MLAYIFLGQVPEKWQLLGMITVVIGLLYYNYYSNLEENQSNEHLNQSLNIDTEHEKDSGKGGF